MIQGAIQGTADAAVTVGRRPVGAGIGTAGAADDMTLTGLCGVSPIW